MAENSAERVHYYQGQYLGAQDFLAEQQYHRDMRRRHNVGHHTWGIVVGLALVEREAEGGSLEVWVEPGMAVDGYGREIVVWRPHKLEPAAFQSQSADRHYEVWIGYDEEQTSRAQGGYAGCGEDGQFDRIREQYRIYVQPPVPHPDGVIVDGQLVKPHDTDADLTVPPDLSVPYQEFPASLSARWLVRLGSVHWDGIQFVAAAEGRLDEDRRYIGSVMAELLAPAAELRISDRATAAGFQPGEGGVSVAVKGTLHIDGAWLDFRRGIPASDDLDDGHFALQRGAWTDGEELRVRIGSTETGANRLAIGPQTGETDADFQAALVVLDNGNVGIGVDAPAHPLQVGNGGTPSLAVLDNGNVGIGASAPDHPLQVGDATAPVTLGLRGPDLNPAAATLTLEDNGGANSRWFRLLYNTQDNLLKITSAEVDPILTVARTTGNVGIATDTPAEALEVNGSVRGNQSGALRIQTESGWTDIGSKNASWSHFYTDRPRYYFNKEIRVDSGFVGSYNEDLTLATGGVGRITVRESDGNVGIGTTTPRSQLEVHGAVRLGNNGSLFALGAGQQLRVVAGNVSSGGGVLAGSGFNVRTDLPSVSGPGAYLIEFTASFSGTPIVLVSTNNAGGDDQLANARNVTASSFVVHTADVERPANTPDVGLLQDTAFSFIALGPP